MREGTFLFFGHSHTHHSDGKEKNKYGKQIFCLFEYLFFSLFPRFQESNSALPVKQATNTVAADL
jgi:hypothetical protein